MNREHYHRVTEVLSIISSKGLNFMYRKYGKVQVDMIMQETGEIGTNIHKYLKNYCLKKQGKEFEEIEIEGNEKDMADMFAKWIDDNVQEFLFFEQGCWHDDFQYRGTPDLVCRVKGDDRLILVDWKTSTSVRPSFALQTAAYVQALKFSQGFDIERRIIVRVTRELKMPPIKEYGNLDAHFRLFLYALGLSRGMVEI